MAPEAEGERHAAEATDGLPAGLAALLDEAGEPGRPRPVERWDPAHCGAMDLVIGADGAWLYRGSPIRREALVRLFASVLRREADGGYVLVTPAEKLTIRVEDAPFRAVEMAVDGTGAAQRLSFRTDVGDVVTAGAAHPLRFETDAGTGGFKPYLRVRGGLDALVARSLVVPIVDRAVAHGGRDGIWSDGAFFPFPDGSNVGG